MTECLERVLASDYRKMEVVVFDDESADDTSILVNSFAHAGVRFVPGTELPEGWLGRNRALEILARESSGTYIIFLNVDTNIHPDTISQLVTTMHDRQLEMASIIPSRDDVWRVSVLLGQLRYFWKIIISSANHPATSSSLWVIKRSTFLSTIGGFVSHKSEVEPEQSIAAIVGNRAYQCFVSLGLGVTYQKDWAAQTETSRRVLFPMSGGTAFSALLSLVALALLNSPLVLLIIGVMVGWPAVSSVAAVLLALFGFLYARYLRVVWTRHWLLGVAVWPFVVLQETVLYMYSAYGYATHSVTWKGRPVRPFSQK